MRFLIILCLVVMPVTAFCAPAQETPRQLTIQLDSVDIIEALAQISQQAQISILGDTTVKGKVSCNLNGVTVEQALNTISIMNNLEWVKVYASSASDERLNATKLFTLIDSLKDLGDITLICDDPKAESRTIFVPGTKSDAVKASTLATDLNLKAVYVLRVKPDPAAVQAEKERKMTAEIAQSQLQTQPPVDPRIAADQVWNYFDRMPMQQRGQVLGELRNKFMESLSPEQMEGMRRMFFELRQRGGEALPQGDNRERYRQPRQH